MAKDIMTTEESKAMLEIMEKHSFNLPQEGEKIEGIVVGIGKNEVLVDLSGKLIGMARGPELFDESGEYNNLKVGDKVEATVLEQENEKGLVEISFRAAGHKKAWDGLIKLMEDKKVVESDVIDANKGGLLVRVGRISGFLPVSQLTMEHYPRVDGGNKNRILERLQSYITKKFKVRVIAVDEPENKLIVSEKAAFSEIQKESINKYKVGDKVSGIITGVVGFGAFIEFGDNDDKLEGLVHISELAWQRIDDPKDVVAVGDEVKAEIISIEDGRISLSTRKLITDPWVKAVDKYKPGQTVKGLVIKTNPFGAFVELDKDIHGLVHISELSWDKVNDPKDIVEPGKEYKFKILSIEPKNHRLGLSLKALHEKKLIDKSEEKSGKDKETKEDKKEEIKEDKKPAEKSKKAKETKEDKKEEKKSKKEVSSEEVEVEKGKKQ